MRQGIAKRCPLAIYTDCNYFFMVCGLTTEYFISMELAGFAYCVFLCAQRNQYEQKRNEGRQEKKDCDLLGPGSLEYATPGTASSSESKCMHPSGGNSVHRRLWGDTCERSPRRRQSLNSFTPRRAIGLGTGRKGNGVSSEDPTSDLQLPSPHFHPRTEAKKKSRFCSETR